MKIDHILVTTDFSETSDTAAQVAKKMAEATKARVSLVHVYDPTPLGPAVTYPAQVWSGSDLGVQIRTASTRELDRMRAEIFAGLARIDTQALPHSSAALAICDYADEHDADLVVVGTHGRTGLEHLLIGSVAENVVRHAPCPVLAVRRDTDVAQFPSRIVVATDFSPNAESGLDWAAELNDLFGAQVTVAHVYDITTETIGGEQIEFEQFDAVDGQLKKALSKLHQERFGGSDVVKTELLVGAPASEALTAYADENGADLIVVTTHGRTGLKRLLVGSVAEKIVRRASCPVLTSRLRQEAMRSGST